jgi:hypothetical protein
VHRPDVLAALALAQNELVSQPFSNPRLQTHAIKNCPPGTFTSYVGNQGHRLIWRLIGRVIVLLLVDEHDAAYRRAERLRLEIDDSQNTLRVVDVDPKTDEPQPYVVRRQYEGALFMAWNDTELREMGFTEQEISVLRRLDDEDTLLDLEPRMREEAFGVACNLVMYGHPEGETAAEDSRRMSEVEEASAEAQPTFFLVDEAEDRAFAAALAEEGTKQELIPVTAEDLERILAAPIEDWMVYLDPSQQSLVERRFNGPARIRGAAGTGKTVVALHRARHAARQSADSRVLFTTFIRSIPPVLDHVFERFAPEEAERVEFKGLHSWAFGLLSRAGRVMNIDVNRVNRAWARACDRHLVAGSPLLRHGLTRSYLRDEVDWIIKGRALVSLDDYIALQRSGRGTPLGRGQREAVWQLYVSYENELRQAGISDFNDLLIAAYELVEDQGIDPPYTAVIVDEAQDLTEIGIRLLHAAAGDGDDGFLLVGDGQQSIYPGGFSLASLGVDIRGRAALLTRNYRNTRQVIEAALDVVEDQPYDDGGQILERGKRDVEVTRDGDLPIYVGFDNRDDHDLGLAADIEAALDAGCGAGDVAILVPTNRMVTDYASVMSRIGLTTQKLDQYDGYPSSHIKVGTYQRAKGLEFKRVYLPRVDSAGLGEARRRGEDDDTYAERLALLRRQLFVAMSRARDALWLGWIGEPASLIHPPPTPDT